MSQLKMNNSYPAMMVDWAKSKADKVDLAQKLTDANLLKGITMFTINEC